MLALGAATSITLSTSHSLKCFSFFFLKKREDRDDVLIALVASRLKLSIY